MFFNVLKFSCLEIIFGILLVLPLGMARQCGFNPGGAVVRRKNNSTYPYFGMTCVQDSDCGDCDLDLTCTCKDGCCAPTGGVFGNYTCLNQVSLFYNSLPVHSLMFPLIMTASIRHYMHSHMYYALFSTCVCNVHRSPILLLADVIWRKLLMASVLHVSMRGQIGHYGNM